MHQVRLTKPAQKQFKKLDSRYKSAINKAFSRIAQDPMTGKTLAGELKGYRRLRFSRYRIIYQVKHQQLIVFVVDIKHRKDAYK
ncbi:MAG: type II toxin-antitoxin system RelE/ParE family toxin [Candidatus Pacebacteria bacterium]|jgi:mRNA interferase RelE/StbE|nr:type II toxin-antitoxin system RelE/ParE family toxin [Candidatus Paceibacterota bacterium]MBT4005386.1 type II toxin-antitoxin system RelE/ParE family toxin [Candidatus Paceibacterota bacterium]MBT4359095.1 type II toxin-antitoxin system RelE/ParE family toxin [Candidatus Paceibacterota bacterium]MBT6899047.1 type II toxin-antitoxin system RelE/ParE family toxin [Candidatus Paceibacterota bacterium]MBT7183567.1 type II toxin-antitoxin system RelE/ParE family toxin [Candidatus Paceibacterota